ncbi:glycoprotein-N-acetylgalactosamine 3-beta-galactosyltransferase 1-like [Haliotis rubra]|uniref:glycoprotein-N-acetylgalactosamine 3-beta-galactosyltransferase 1-like n=1 Tax=Haliotis rubra TaxID=36100 RepID=UPI001EE501EB|nr:glycoprotein-N-acetylgalactosamine 3-beta-galactosyltransferase 1-like [Haliotis rubra]
MVNSHWYMALGLMTGLMTTVIMLDAFASRHTKLQRETRRKFPIRTPGQTFRNSGIRLLCWILTQPCNFANKTRSVKETWTKRCDITLFFSSEANSEIPTIKLDVPEGRDYLADKSFAVLKYLFKHYHDKADWFYKADDDTYVIVENLRHFLGMQNTNGLYYYGEVFDRKELGVYNSGGAGYALGKEGLKRIALFSDNVDACHQAESEDVRVGVCLKALGIDVGEATDSFGRPIFNWNKPVSIIQGDWPDWVIGIAYVQSGVDAVCPVAASFHYVGPTAMRIMDFFLYNLTIHDYDKPHKSNLF